MVALLRYRGSSRTTQRAGGQRSETIHQAVGGENWVGDGFYIEGRATSKVAEADEQILTEESGPSDSYKIAVESCVKLDSLAWLPGPDCSRHRCRGKEHALGHERPTNARQKEKYTAAP